MHGDESEEEEAYQRRRMKHEHEDFFQLLCGSSVCEARKGFIYSTVNLFYFKFKKWIIVSC